MLYLGADHNGYRAKEQLKKYLEDKLFNEREYIKEWHILKYP